jgi:predicted dehydrogenase
MKLKAGVIGAGWVGLMHAQAYTGATHAELVGVADIAEDNARRLGEKFEVSHTTDYHELLDTGVQIVSIATPPYLHYEMAKEALEKEIHVLVEKPITLDLNEAEELVRLSEEGNARLMVGFSERFHVGFKAAKERIAQIGRPYMAHGRWMHRASSKKGWIWEVDKSGGLIVDLGIFMIDLLRWLMESEVRMVECRSGNFVYLNAKSEDSAIMLLKFKNNSFASIDISRFLPKSFPSPLDVGLRIFGTKGILTVDTTTSLPLQIYTEEKAVIPDLLRAPGMWISDEVEHFLEAIVHNTPHMCTARDGKIALEVALGARRSAELHERVVFG